MPSNFPICLFPCVGGLNRRVVRSDYDQFITRIVHLEQMWDPPGMSANTLMAMDRHQQFAVQCPKQHAMPEIGRRDRLFLMYPGSVQCTTRRISDALRINIVYPACPEHAETSGLRTENIGAVRYFIGTDITIFILFPAPGRTTGT